MTPGEFRAARHHLGLSASRMAWLVGVADGRLVRRYESGAAVVGGGVATAILLCLWLHANGHDPEAIVAELRGQPERALKRPS